MLLFEIVRFVNVRPAGTTVVASDNGLGAIVLDTAEAFAQAIIPQVTTSIVDAAVLVPVPLPLKLRFLIVTLSQLVTIEDVAKRTHEVYVIALVAVFLIVKFLFIPAVFGLSPSIITLSDPLNSIKPLPVVVVPETVTPSTVGAIPIEV